MISSVHNPLVLRARRLHKRSGRARTAEFLVEGAHGIGEALAAGTPLAALFVLAAGEGEGEGAEAGAGLGEAAAAAGVPVHKVSAAVMAALSATEQPPGAVAIAPFVDVPAPTLLEDGGDLFVVLDQVRDPGNLGTVLRAAWAAGAAGVFLSGATVDLYNAKVVRASAGALFRVPVAREVAIPWILAELGARKIRRIAADPAGQVPYEAVPMVGPCALVFGNEAWGLPPEVLAAVDDRASIPMRAAAESLNVGVSAAVFLFEAGRQRREQ
ncbi:MAG TPA: RNA methyltransferase [Actinomycetota bacterium]|nr:RNA methyltransferase [Actinomycetota bacterium]